MLLNMSLLKNMNTPAQRFTFYVTFECFIRGRCGYLMTECDSGK